MDGGALALRVRVTDLAVVVAISLNGAWATRWHAAVLILGCGSALFMLHAFDCYLFRASETLKDHLTRLFLAAGAYSAPLMALSWVMRPDPAGAPAIIRWWLMLAAATTSSHLAWFVVIQRLRHRGLLAPNLVVVGATPAAERLVRAALAHREAYVLGIFDDRKSRGPDQLFGVPVLGSMSDLVGHRILPYVDRIILAVPGSASGRIADLLATLQPIPNPISLLLDQHDETPSRQERLLDLPLAQLSGARSSWVRSQVKRSLDIILSAAALVVLLPVFLAIAAAIALDSPGSVFFRQRRHGFLGEEVMVWKFRTMRSDRTDLQARQQVRPDDDRITRVGRFLRRTSLDELPQLWNVLRGEMSLVGPRPHAVGMLTAGTEASRLVETYAHRHRIKPGLTGWAAVKGSRGPVDTPEAVRRRIALDLDYIERQSVWLDLAIMLRTVPCLLGDRSSVR
jgi:Undecaprenyl-phosphate glucose phosphotransferase